MRQECHDPTLIDAASNSRKADEGDSEGEDKPDDEDEKRAGTATIVMLHRRYGSRSIAQFPALHGKLNSV